MTKISNVTYVEYLLKNGADAAASDNVGWTPLHGAAQNGSEAITKLLLTAGADISAEDHKWRSPLFCALTNKHEILARLLIDMGAKLSTMDRNGFTPLHLAARNGFKSIFETLLQAGADPKAADKDGYTVLHSAAESEAETSPHIIQALLDLGADPSLLDSKGDTALHILGWSESDNVLGIAKSFLDHGSDPAATNVDGLTPLHHAVEFGTIELVNLLLSKNSSPCTSASFKGTPLNIAAQQMDEQKIRALLQHGSDINTLDCYGHSCGDWISTFLPLACTLPPFLQSYKPVAADDARRHVIDCLGQRIALAFRVPVDERDQVLFRLGKQLLFLKDEENAITAFGITYWYTRRKPWNETCTECNQNVDISGRFICTVCPTGIFCTECAATPLKKKYRWCSSHKLVQIPSERREKLVTGVVNSKGQIVEDWLKSVQDKYFN